MLYQLAQSGGLPAGGPLHKHKVLVEGLAGVGVGEASRSKTALAPTPSTERGQAAAVERAPWASPSFHAQLNVASGTNSLHPILTVTLCNEVYDLRFIAGEMEAGRS